MYLRSFQFLFSNLDMKTNPLWEDDVTPGETFTGERIIRLDPVPEPQEDSVGCIKWAQGGFRLEADGMPLPKYLERLSLPERRRVVPFIAKQIEKAVNWVENALGTPERTLVKVDDSEALRWHAEVAAPEDPNEV